MVKIRLARFGKKKTPFYRIVALDSREKRDGAYLASFGTYDALKSAFVNYDLPGVEAWMAKGAQMSDSVKKLHAIYKRQNA